MTPPNPQLLRSLGKLARGLSALFWGLPAALLVGAETARADWLKPLGFLPALAVNALLSMAFGRWRIFRSRNAPGGTRSTARAARARSSRPVPVHLLAQPAAGTSFLYRRRPGAGAGRRAVPVQLESRAQAPRRDAAGRDAAQETRQFTAFNRWLLVGLLFFAIVVAALVQLPHPAPPVGKVMLWVNRASSLLLIFFILLPLAMTMALIWKTKEVILDAVFGARG